MLKPMSRERIPMRLAKMLMNGKRETAPFSEEMAGFKRLIPTVGAPAGSESGIESMLGDSSCSFTGIVSRKNPEV